MKQENQINGLNFYCYCYKNAINKIESAGHFAISLTILCLIIGAVVEATTGDVVAYDIVKKSLVECCRLAGY